VRRRGAGFEQFGGDAQGVRGDVLEPERAGVGDDAGEEAGCDVGCDRHVQCLQQGVDDLRRRSRVGVEDADVTESPRRDVVVYVHNAPRPCDKRLDRLTDARQFAAVHDEG